ncbi:hypothetical protein PPERSA_10965 [Pseudocohnilembus persalinus]|uniref:3-hydroxyisobutyryl-CoA hydrolase n=1 Tax=Pseudocohnilembus persalinus TaxID=266149 RepID=A0A0V0QC65_PSEPJ|nr:hypothetical protein PPERSA_10965 [Pseudocohnilembus persalinus]|eukprot:KRW99846.1 hypothetical protein PPERSA_10965 [Pseudocohnilembus persalinus]
MIRITRHLKKAIQQNRNQKQGLVNVVKQQLTNPRVLSTKQQLEKDPKTDLYNLVGKRVGNIAVVKFNRAYKRNLLSASMISELKRFLASYELDPTIRAIQLQGEQGQILSQGTDFTSILKNIQEGNHELNAKYFKDLYELAFQISKFNKPLLINLNGEVNNSAIALLSNAPFSLPSNATTLKFDDIDYGFVPQLGASYIYSRLPYYLGTYLFLTGETLQGKGAFKSGFGSHFVENLKEFISNLQDAHIAYDNSFTSEELYGDQFTVDNMKYKDSKSQFYKNLQQEIRERIIDTGFRENENGKLAMSEIMYKKELAEYQNRNQEEFSRLGYKGQQSVNHLLEYEEKVLNSLQMANLEISNGKTFDEDHNAAQLKVIARCFSANNVEEIMVRLEEESKSNTFANETLEKLRVRNPVALKLSLELLIRGRESTWMQALQNEFRVIIRRLRDEDFAQDAIKQLGRINSGKKVELGENRWENVSKEKIEGYFEPLENGQEFGESQIQNGLFPVRDYYREYPDVIRYFLNEENIQDPNLLMNYEFDVKNFLHSKNIDFLRSWTLNTSVLRANIFAKEFQKQQIQLQLQKISNLSSDPKSIQLYSREKQEFVRKYYTNENSQKIQEQVNDVVQEIFEEYFDKRMEGLKKISEKAFIQKKQEFFLRIRKNILENRMMRTQRQEIQENLFDLEQQGEQFSLDFSFSDKNSENIFDQQKHQVEKSPLFGLLQELKSLSEKDAKFLKNFNLDKEKIELLLIDLESQNYSERYYGLNQTKKTSKDRRIEEHQQRFGSEFGEEYDNYLLNLIHQQENKDQNIQQFLSNKSSEEVKNMIKSEKKRNYRAIGEQLLKDIEEKQQKQQFIEDRIGRDPQVLAVKKTLKEINNGVENYSRLLDIQTELKQDQNQQQQNNGLERFLDNDKHLKQLISIFIPKEDLLQDKQKQQQQDNIKECQAVKQLRQRFNNLLTSIYKGKLEQILVREKEMGLDKKSEFLTPQLTKNGNGIDNNFNHGDTYMKFIDDFLQGNLDQDFHNFISSHIFFTFAALGLEQLSEVFKGLYNISRKFNLGGGDEGTQKINNMVTSLQNNLGLPIQDGKDIQQIIDYLNDATEQFCVLYMMYKDKLVFPEDKLLALTNQAKQIKERDYDDLGFANYVLTAYQQKQNNQQAIEKEEADLQQLQVLDRQELEQFLQKKVFITNPSFRDQQLTEKQIKQIESQIYTLNSYRQERNLVPSTLIYIEKLDLLTQQIIHGRDHFLPEEEKLMMQELPHVLKHIDPSTQANEWARSSLKKFISSLFEIRYRNEKNMTQQELTLFDIQMAEFLSPEYLQKQLLEEISVELMHLRVIGDILQYQKQQEGKDPIIESFRRKQYEEKKQIKNFDAQQKLLAFQIMQANTPNMLLQQKKGSMPKKQSSKNKKKNLDSLKKEQRKEQLQRDSQNLLKGWMVQERLEKEVNQIENSEISEKKIQDLYRNVLQTQDFSMGQEEEISDKIRRMREFAFSNEEIQIPMRKMAEEKEFVDDGLREEIQGFLNMMK